MSLSPTLGTLQELPELERNSPIALQKQLGQLLRTKIKNGEWTLGELIPREIDFMARYNLSRYAVRQVLEELVQEGLLVRTKKRGTIVSRPKVQQELGRFYSFARDMAAKNLKPTSFVLRLEKINEPDEETTLLIPPNSDQILELYHLRRLRVLDNEPFLIESSYLAFSQKVAMFDYDWRNLPLYEVLETYYGIKVERAVEYLEPVVLDQEEAVLLGVASGTPAFRVERLTYDNHNRAFERRISLIRGDRYRFYVELPKVELMSSVD